MKTLFRYLFVSIVSFFFIIVCNATTNEDEKKPVINGHEYVDMGFPSGTLWATCNVGATKPEEYGDYYAWGEVTPKDVYDWSTYKWCSGSDTTMTKYCLMSDFGKVDNKQQLEPQDDVAHVLWGGGWRIPTHSEMLELDGCSWKWTILNGVKGFEVKSPYNGNTIFLPAAGYRSNSNLLNAGTFCNLIWTSTVEHDSWFACISPFITRTRHGIYHCERYEGHQIRPVVSRKKTKK